MAEPAVIAALLCSSAHGYDLRKTVFELTDGRIEVDPGGLYRILRRLEADGFVASRWEESEAGPQRREYELTQEGRELAQDWLRHLRERQELTRMLGDALEHCLVRSRNDGKEG